MTAIEAATTDHATDDLALSKLPSGKTYASALPSALSEAWLHLIGRNLLQYESFLRGYALGADGERCAEARPKALMKLIVGARGRLDLQRGSQVRQPQRGACCTRIRLSSNARSSCDLSNSDTKTKTTPMPSCESSTRRFEGQA